MMNNYLKAASLSVFALIGIGAKAANEIRSLSEKNIDKLNKNVDDTWEQVKTIDELEEQKKKIDERIQKIKNSKKYTMGVASAAYLKDEDLRVNQSKINKYFDEGGQ